jgi:hypothetical protein
MNPDQLFIQRLSERIGQLEFETIRLATMLEASEQELKALKAKNETPVQKPSK